MIYADEAYYKTVWLCGRQPVITDAFAFYAREASRIIDRFTHGRLDGENVPKAASMCCCELAEILYREDSAERRHGGISAESVQGWSQSYESAESRKTALAAAQRACVYRWLGDTGLLFAGVTEC